MSEQLNYQKGYDKGFSDAQEFLAQKFDKAYEKGFEDGLLKFKEDLKLKKKKSKKKKK